MLFCCCGLFDTREAQMPENTRSTFEPPLTADAVSRNLVNALIEKNSVNYIKCLRQDLRYTPDSKSQQIYGEIFRNWNINSEKFYFDNLIAQTNINASSNLFLSNTVINPITTDSSILTSDYIVVFQHNLTNIPKSALGKIILSLNADENNFYSISRWDDFRKNDTDFTWSELKANFSN